MNPSAKSQNEDFQMESKDRVHCDEACYSENHTGLPFSGTCSWCSAGSVTPHTLQGKWERPLPTPGPLVTESQQQYSLNCTLGVKACPCWVRGDCEQPNRTKHTAHHGNGCHAPVTTGQGSLITATKMRLKCNCDASSLIRRLQSCGVCQALVQFLAASLLHPLHPSPWTLLCLDQEVG